MTKNILCTVSGLQPEFGDMRALHQWCRHFFGTDSRVDVDLCTGVNVTIFERGPNPIPHVMMFDFWRYPDTVPTAAEISAGLHTDSRWVNYGVYVIQQTTKGGRWAAPITLLRQVQAA